MNSQLKAEPSGNDQPKSCVLTLDLGTHTGWALLQADGSPSELKRPARDFFARELGWVPRVTFGAIRAVPEGLVADGVGTANRPSL